MTQTDRDLSLLADIMAGKKTTVIGQEALEFAMKTISQSRQDDYGDADENLTRIAQGWSLIFQRHVCAHQVALAMDWLKTCRLIVNPEHRDSWVDKLGYTAIGSELVIRKDKP